MAGVRIESRKGQLDLVTAAQNMREVDFLLVGKPSEFGGGYYDKVKSLAGHNVEFRCFVEQSELRQFYSEAVVHVLPS